jgi:hypothetical protein
MIHAKSLMRLSNQILLNCKVDLIIVVHLMFLAFYPNIYPLFNSQRMGISPLWLQFQKMQKHLNVYICFCTKNEVVKKATTCEYS